MCEFGNARICLGIAAPVSPDSVSDGVRDAWMLRYPKLLEEYYAVCRQAYASYRGGGFSVGGCGDGGDAQGKICGCYAGSVHGSCVSRGCGLDIKLLGHVGGAEVGAQVCEDVDLPEAVSAAFAAEGVGCAGVDEVSCLERDSSRSGELRHEFGSSSGHGKVVSVSDDVVVGSPVDSRLRSGVSTGVVDGDSLSGGGGFTTFRGKHYLRNKRKKAARSRARVSQPRLASGTDSAGSWIRDRENRVSGDLRESLERKWRAQNELAAEKASRALVVLQQIDVAEEARRYRTKVAVQSERNMVGIERAHATLKATGNVPSVPGGGFAETVVSDEVPSLSSGSISPNSSASMAEFRAQQKMLLDVQAELETAKKALARFNFSIEAERNFDKETFTDDTEGNVLLDQLDDYGGIHYVERDGVMKMKRGPNNDIIY